MSFLHIKNLNIDFQTPDRIVHAVRDFNLDMEREKIAIVGESGAGKSQTARAILGISRGTVSQEEFSFDGIDMLSKTAKEQRQIRTSKMAMIMQDPKYSLNPIFKVGSQLLEVLPNVNKHIAKQQILSVLADVNIRDPEKVYNAYPFELSGGMGQRVMIAQTLLLKPELLIADEPTSSIDATAKRSVLDEIDKLINDYNMGMIFISHDLPLVASFCDKIVVMFYGEIVEVIAAKELKHAQHPYTQALLSCIPRASYKGQLLKTVNRDEITQHMKLNLASAETQTE